MSEGGRRTMEKTINIYKTSDGVKTEEELLFNFLFIINKRKEYDLFKSALINE